MYLKEIDRTAMVAWGPAFQQQPLLATGTVAGALDASFSTNSELEIFNISLQETSTAAERVAVIPTTARFNRLAWSSFSIGPASPASGPSQASGIIAGGMEDGSVCLWDARRAIVSSDSALISSRTLFNGPVRGLDFNPHTPFLLAIGSVDAQLSLMDMHDPSKVYAPGQSKSQRMEDITGLAWNPKVGHILAVASSNGVTAIWDLRAKKEAVQFATPGRVPISSIAWNPDLSSQLLTASEDNNSPYIYSWDLRNAHAPEKSLSGHTKGVLSMAWCPKDPELLLSSGKDNRTIFWNPKAGSMIGELLSKDSWVFDVQFCPKNPDLLSAAAFDGKVNVYSYQAVSGSLISSAKTQSGLDSLFGSGNAQHPSTVSAEPSVKQVPKWLRCPSGVRFGFGGRVAVFSQGKKVSLLRVSQALLSSDLDSAIANGTLGQFCSAQASEITSSLKRGSEEALIWTVLKVLNEPEPKKALLELAGVSQEEMTESSPSHSALSNMNELNESLAAPASASISPVQTQPTSAISSTFADPGSFRPTLPPTPNESFEHHDFFAQSTGELAFEASAGNLDFAREDASLKRRSTFSGLPFSLYSSDDTAHDQKITRAIISGNFKDAVDACIAADKLSDALLVAVCGGPELVSRTQRIYFQKVRSPYLRVVSGILKKDLSDVIENASLVDWVDLLALVLSFSADDLHQKELLECLAGRLTTDANASFAVPAIVCYLASGNVIKASALIVKVCNNSAPNPKDPIRYVQWLASMVEKIRVAQLTNPQTSMAQVVKDIPDLSKFLLYYSFLLAESGQVVQAAYYMALLLPSAEGVVAESKAVGEFAERLAVAVPSAGLQVSKPFASVDVPIYQAQPTPTSQSQPQQSSQYVPIASASYEPQYNQATLAAVPYGYPSGTSTTGPAYPSVPNTTVPYGQQQSIQTPYGHVPTQNKPAQSYAPPVPGMPTYGQTSVPTFSGVPSQPYGQSSQSQPPVINQQAASPYGQPTSNPYGQAASTAPSPYGQQPAPSPYGHAPQQQQEQPHYPSYGAPPQNQSSQPAAPYPPRTNYPLPSAPQPAPYGSAQAQQAQPTISAAQFSQPRTNEGFNDAPIVAPRAVATAKSPQLPPPPIPPAPSGPSVHPPQSHQRPEAVVPPVEKKTLGTDLLLTNTVGPPDASKVLSNQLPIYTAITAFIRECESRASPVQKRAIEDASKRLQLLLSQLTHHHLSLPVVDCLLSVCQAITERQWDSALHGIQGLTTAHFGETGGWILGLKRLVEMQRG